MREAYNYSLPLWIIARKPNIPLFSQATAAPTAIHYHAQQEAAFEISAKRVFCIATNSQAETLKPSRGIPRQNGRHADRYPI
ncbi:hypothetical protein AFLA_010225 [Aspergillus flavus NRRL3357]|nr:hypothetical protein AFLA_010225 [Aspergillus flavus NRRL3357]